MCWLDPSSIETSEKIRKFLKSNFTEEKLKKFECRICKGTGLKYHGEIDKSWSGEFCNLCKGIGFIKIDQIDETIFY